MPAVQKANENILVSQLVSQGQHQFTSLLLALAGELFSYVTSSTRCNAHFVVRFVQAVPLLPSVHGR